MAFDPLKPIKDEVEALVGGVKTEIKEIKKDVRIAVETELLRESVRFQLSRLLTLDTDRSEAYGQALSIIGEE